MLMWQQPQMVVIHQLRVLVWMLLRMAVARAPRETLQTVAEFMKIMVTLPTVELPVDLAVDLAVTPTAQDVLWQAVRVSLAREIRAETSLRNTAARPVRVVVVPVALAVPFTVRQHRVVLAFSTA
jgi:hypothetical protein